MRDIKFRLWHDNAGLMLFVGDKHGTSHPLDCCIYYMQGQGSHLMQYTGETDIDGVDIYEGDIVASCDWEGKVETILGIVTFNNNNYARLSAFHVCDKDSESVEFYYGQRCSECCGEKTKVVGNIYENPEMLDRME